MPRIITIIGQKEVGKTTLFRQLVKKYSLTFQHQPSPIINYIEEMIRIENNLYKLIDTPALVFSPKSEIELGIKKQIEELIKKSDLICWVVNQIDEGTLLLNKYLSKEKKLLILLPNKIDLENNQEDIHAYQV